MTDSNFMFCFFALPPARPPSLLPHPYVTFAIIFRENWRAFRTRSKTGFSL